MPLAERWSRRSRRPMATPQRGSWACMPHDNKEVSKGEDETKTDDRDTCVADSRSSNSPKSER